METSCDFTDFLERYFTDPDGIIYSQIDRSTLKPATQATFAGAKPEDQLHETCIPEWHVTGYTRAEVSQYENSGMATGASLAAAVLEYKRTGDPAALARAKRLFNGLKTIQTCGATYEPGFITKYYGARFTYEASNDQCLYHIYGMDAYREIASDEDKAYIEKIIPEIVRFWVRHNYTYSYFHLKDMKWPPLRFPGILTIAWKYSGEEMFKSEADRLMAENIDCVPEFAMIPRYRNRRYSDYEESHNVRYFSGMADSVTMDIMHLNLLLKYDPESQYADAWRKGVEVIWDEARRVITPDGKAYTLAIYHMDDGTTTEPPADCPLPWAKTAWSTMIVRAGLMGLQYMPHRKQEIQEVANLVLNSLSPADMTYFEDLHGYPPEQQFLDRFLSGDAIANWLWAWELLHA